MTVYLSSAYLAPVEYYTKLLAYDQIYIEQHDHYTKQTYRNRCTIAAPDGELALSIPTVKPVLAQCSGVGIEMVGMQSLLFGPIMESFFFEVETAQSVFRT